MYDQNNWEIEYPDAGFYGNNLLSENPIEFRLNHSYSLAVNITGFYYIGIKITFPDDLNASKNTFYLKSENPGNPEWTEWDESEDGNFPDMSNDITDDNEHPNSRLSKISLKAIGPGLIDRGISFNGTTSDGKIEIDIYEKEPGASEWIKVREKSYSY